MTFLWFRHWHLFYVCVYMPDHADGLFLLDFLFQLVKFICAKEFT